MRRPSSAQLAGVAAVAAIVVAAACGGSDSNGPNCGSGSPPNLQGEYTLIIYKVGGNPVPGASGDLTLDAATGGVGLYGADLHLLGNEVVDSGTYTLTGSTCIKQESVSGNGTTSGTYTQEGDTVSVTANNTQAGNVFVRWLRVVT